MRETQPSVFKIAETRVDWEEVRRYLEQVGGLEWYERMQDDSFSDAEALVEFAGRGCYRAWAPGLNANVTRVREDSAAYIRNLIDSGHGSPLEHAQVTFVFQDVSRVFTHELVRHRVGVAISQESLRYVRLTDLGVRIPDIIKNGPDIACRPEVDAEGDFSESMQHAIVDIVERLEDFQQRAAEAFSLDDEGVPFHYKKKVTSALRRLAPIGLSTMMTWSANLRTLRFVLEKRTDWAAEEEIRIVFNEVGEILLRDYPLIFGDFEKTYDGTPIPAWIPKASKI